MYRACPLLPPQIQVEITTNFATETIFKATKSQETPIIINNFKRVKYLSQLVEDLRNRGYENIYVIDNYSDSDPLSDYYQTAKLRVFFLNKNIGKQAIWRTPIISHFIDQLYVYTDPDILPITDCPNDFIDLFKDVLNRYPAVDKVGFSLKIDDLPVHYQLKNQVIKHESNFWQIELEPGLYLATIDSTFALYRPGMVGDWWTNGIRTAAPYTARHLTWYENPAESTSENQEYNEAALQTGITHWSRKMAVLKNGNRTHERD